MWPATVALAATLCAIVFYAEGGLNLETMTPTVIALTIASGLALAVGAVTLRGDRPAYGLWPVLLLGAFAALSAISIVWSVQPDESWRDAGRLVAYAGVFATAVLAGRLVPARWPALLGAIVLSSVTVCAYALVTKSLPDHFTAANTYARLYEPFGYWNALGLTAAMGALGCMWLGARRSGHALVSALAYPAMGLLVETLLLAYSRGALVALVLGLIVWFSIVPLRLRGAAVLIAGGIGGGAVAAFDFKTAALSSEGVPLPEATWAGHELGALTLAMVVALALVGIAVTFATGRRPPAPESRRRAGTALIAMLGLAIFAALAALAHSSRGLTGSISHAFHTLTDIHAKVPNTPGRLTAVASVRAQYWDEALKVFKAHPWLGVGNDGYDVARLRYLSGPLAAKHAHGFLVQTLADLGIAGLVLALALIACWLAAAGRATHPFNRRLAGPAELLRTRRPSWRPLSDPQERSYTPERIGMLSMLCLVVVFAAHSLIDWTWYVPGNALPALLCAGWLAGRGPLVPAAAPPSSGPLLQRVLPAGRPGSLRLAIAAVAVAASLVAAWSAWQPLRSIEQGEAALSKLEAGDSAGARVRAADAVATDPLSAEALFVRGHVAADGGRSAEARSFYVQAVKLQPSNPETWLELGRFDLTSDPRRALSELQASIYLSPGSISPEAIAKGGEAVTIYNQYIQALRATQGLSSGSAAPGTAGSLPGG